MAAGITVRGSTSPGERRSSPARRVFALSAAVSLALCCVALATLAWTSVSRDVSATFHARGSLWEIACRGGALLIDNQPQRDTEVTRISAANQESRTRWQNEHDALRFAMEGAPYGPQYTAARLKMDAWEHVHGINWPGGAPENPASPPIEYRLHLLWIVLILLVLPAAWLIAGGPDEARAIPRRLVLAARIGGMALLILLLAVGAQSFRRPVAVYAFRGERSYLLLVSRGRVRLGRPPATDARKLAAAASGFSRLKNTDLIWALRPEFDDPSSSHTYRSPRGPTVSCELRPDVADAAIAQTPATPESICACLSALHDSDRYQAAHIILTRLRFSSAPLPGGAFMGPVQWYGSKVNGLEVQLTPQQLASTQEVLFTPQIAPHQQGKIELQWHQVHDRFTRAFPLWPAAAVLALFPVRWSFAVLRRRRRRKNNQCLACGYSLTGNTSGVCPECGTATSQTTC